jgi:hypothetical protein
VIHYDIISVNWISFFINFGILSNYNTFRRKLFFLDPMQKMREIYEITDKYHKQLKENANLLK